MVFLLVRKTRTRHHHRRGLIDKDYVKTPPVRGCARTRSNKARGCDRKRKIIQHPKENACLARYQGTAMNTNAVEHLVAFLSMLVTGVEFPFRVIGRTGHDHNLMPTPDEFFTNICDSKRLRIIVLKNNENFHGVSVTSFRRRPIAPFAANQRSAST